MKSRTVSATGVLRAVTIGAVMTIGGVTGHAQGRAGNVYVLTNQASGNSVLVFDRDQSGTLTAAGSFATGGSGAGTGADPLASQGALVLSRDQRLLFAANAGSNSVSVFAVSGDQLALLDVEPSGGTMPVSVAVQRDLVYVLNAGGTPNISGFEIDGRSNRLLPLAGSTRALPGGAASAPAQVSFTPDGDALVVTEKNTNQIDTFTLEDGLPGTGASFPSSGATPFGFAFGHDGVLIVSDAAGGPAGTSAVSSYTVDDSGTVALVSPAVPDTQNAACWLVVPQDGRFAYTANAGSGTISSYTVAPGGELTLLQVAAASTGGGTAPTDMALAGGSRFLYVRDGANGAVDGFRVGPRGSLTPVGTVTGVPAGAQGIAAR